MMSWYVHAHAYFCKLTSFMYFINLFLFNICGVRTIQVEETKAESIKKDKVATEKLLQETIEKYQADLAIQKEFYANELKLAKEAEALAETRANSEAQMELESRLKESGERESMLVQALEELRQALTRAEQQVLISTMFHLMSCVPIVKNKISLKLWSVISSLLHFESLNFLLTYKLLTKTLQAVAKEEILRRDIDEIQKRYQVCGI